MIHKPNTKTTIKYSHWLVIKTFSEPMWSQVQNFEHSEGLVAEVYIEFTFALSMHFFQKKALKTQDSQKIS